MALTFKRLLNLGHRCRGDEALRFGGVVEAEVRKQDEALIRQMLEALCLPCSRCRWVGPRTEIVHKAIDAARARLDDKP